MNVVLGVGQYHSGSTAEYVRRALVALGHDVSLAEGDGVVQAVLEDTADLVLCIDSGVALPLTQITGRLLDNVAVWFIDYRHNKLRAERSPHDLAVVEHVVYHGGWIFQAQYEDVLDCLEHGLHRVSWLPLAADPDVWRPIEADREFDLGFVGNVWDASRAAALNNLKSAGYSLAFPGPGAAWGEQGAQVLARAKAGFNISSFFGTPVAFDINMRFFETLSCGVPLITNEVPCLKFLFPGTLPPCIRTYSSLDTLAEAVGAALSDEVFVGSGAIARGLIEQGHTYAHRLREAFDVCRVHAVGPWRPRATANLTFTGVLSLPGASFPRRSSNGAVTVNFEHIVREFKGSPWGYSAEHLATDEPDSCAVVPFETIAGNLLPVYKLSSVVVIGPGALLITESGKLLRESTFYHGMPPAVPQVKEVRVGRDAFRAGEYVLLAGLWADEFWHWTVEYLPRVVIAERMGFAGHYIVDESAPPFVWESLSAAGVPLGRVATFSPAAPLWLDKVIIPRPLRGSAELKLYPELVHEIRERLGVASFATGGNRRARLYVPRAQSEKGRAVSNEAEVLAVLTRHGFEKVAFEDMPFREQLALSATAECIAGPHGAGLVHSLFMEPEATLIEFFNARFIHPVCELATRTLNLRYVPLFDPPRFPHDVQQDHLFSAENIHVNPGRLRAALERCGIE